MTSIKTKFFAGRTVSSIINTRAGTLITFTDGSTAVTLPISHTLQTMSGEVALSPGYVALVLKVPEPLIEKFVTMSHLIPGAVNTLTMTNDMTKNDHDKSIPRVLLMDMLYAAIELEREEKLVHDHFGKEVRTIPVKDASDYLKIKGASLRDKAFGHWSTGDGDFRSLTVTELSAIAIIIGRDRGELLKRFDDQDTTVKQVESEIVAAMNNTPGAPGSDKPPSPSSKRTLTSVPKPGPNKAKVNTKANKTT